MPLTRGLVILNEIYKKLSQVDKKLATPLIFLQFSLRLLIEGFKVLDDFTVSSDKGSSEAEYFCNAVC